MSTDLQVEQEDRGLRRNVVGKVVSDKADKSIVIKVERRVKHPLYKKQIRKVKKYHAHDENNEAKVGDSVRIVETRPLSRLKRWRLVQIISS